MLFSPQVDILQTKTFCLLWCRVQDIEFLELQS